MIAGGVIRLHDQEAHNIELALWMGAGLKLSRSGQISIPIKQEEPLAAGGGALGGTGSGGRG